MTKQSTAVSNKKESGGKHESGRPPEAEGGVARSSLLPATPAANASASDSRASKQSASAVGSHTPTRLPPSAPTSSLLPSVANALNPSQLLAQYSLLLQGGSNAGAFLNPFLGNSAGASSAAVVPSSGAAASLVPTPSLPGGESAPSNMGGSVTAPVASQLISSLAAQIVAAQQASAQVAAVAAAAAAYKAPAPAAPAAPPAPAPVAAPSRPDNMILRAGAPNWSSAQLANQPRLLSSLSQPVPPSLSLLVTEAQRRHEKKEAKKVANRRSASVSRARKKALVQEMTELNARLKRQALILALLPDLVVVVDAEGVITFCSSQVERVLSYAPDVLVGSKLTDLLVPSSRAKLLKLFKELVGSGGNLEPSCNEADFSNNKKRRRSIKALKDVSEESDLQDRSEDVKSNSAPSSKGKAGAEASDASFPMSVVNVDVDSKPEAEKQTSDDNEDNSDTSASRDSKRPSSLTNSVRSPIVDSGNSGSDDGDKKVKGKKASGKKLPSSDTSNTSSSMDQANANLERNVRWHNKKLKSLQSDEDGFYKDDVIGAAVTANNASARLSSLRVLADRPEDRPEGSSSEEDDSGYRESNESREETSSTSTSDLTESNGRRKPLAPTCNICLIRSDLSTLWCEVTSSVRTRDSSEDLDDGATVDTRKPPPDASSVSNDTEVDVLPDKSAGAKEILLCLRPIRDGDEKIDPKFRFVAKEKREVSDGSMTGPSSSVSAQRDPSSSEQGQKRKASGAAAGRSPKRTRADSDVGAQADVAASLMLMFGSKN